MIFFKGRETDAKSSQLLVHFSNALNGWSWARTKLKARNLISVSRAELRLEPRHSETQILPSFHLCFLAPHSLPTPQPLSFFV